MSNDSEGAPQVRDEFLASAEAMFKTWAAKMSELHDTKEDLAHTQGDLAVAHARIEELTRANQQLDASLKEGLARESQARESLGILRGLMQGAGLTLAEGLAKAPLEKLAAMSNGTQNSGKNAG